MASMEGCSLTCLKRSTAGSNREGAEEEEEWKGDDFLIAGFRAEFGAGDLLTASLGAGRGLLGVKLGLENPAMERREIMENSSVRKNDAWRWHAGEARVDLGEVIRASNENGLWEGRTLQKSGRDND